jgi:antitoxin YefM
MTQPKPFTWKQFQADYVSCASISFCSMPHCDYFHELLDLYNILHKCVDMRIVSFSEARNSLKTVLDHVVEDADYTIITRRDAEDAVVMSLEYFNSLLETVYLLKSPANAAHLERSIAQFKEGEVLEHELLSD